MPWVYRGVSAMAILGEPRRLCPHHLPFHGTIQRLCHAVPRPLAVLSPWPLLALHGLYRFSALGVSWALSVLLSCVSADNCPAGFSGSVRFAAVCLGSLWRATHGSALWLTPNRTWDFRGAVRSRKWRHQICSRSWGSGGAFKLALVPRPVVRAVTVPGMRLGFATENQRCRTHR